MQLCRRPFGGFFPEKRAKHCEFYTVHTPNVFFSKENVYTAYIYAAAAAAVVAAAAAAAVAAAEFLSWAHPHFSHCIYLSVFIQKSVIFSGLPHGPEALRTPPKSNISLIVAVAVFRLDNI